MALLQLLDRYPFPLVWAIRRPPDDHQHGAKGNGRRRGTSKIRLPLRCPNRSGRPRLDAVLEMAGEIAAMCCGSIRLVKVPVKNVVTISGTASWRAAALCIPMATAANAFKEYSP